MTAVRKAALVGAGVAIASLVLELFGWWLPSQAKFPLELLGLALWPTAIVGLIGVSLPPPALIICAVLGISLNAATYAAVVASWCNRGPHRKRWRVLCTTGLTIWLGVCLWQLWVTILSLR